MGCTLVGVTFTDEGVLWVSVGDSPFWRVREGEIKQLNADHSMAPVIALKVSNGELSREEAALHPQRNALRSALVGEPIPQTDLRETPIRVRDGDRFVLASDGLQTLQDEEIAEIVMRRADALDLARDLVDAVEAKKRRGQDNTTVIVVAPTLVGDATPIVDWSR
jgi:protein phosphatase